MFGKDTTYNFSFTKQLFVIFMKFPSSNTRTDSVVSVWFAHILLSLQLYEPAIQVKDLATYKIWFYLWSTNLYKDQYMPVLSQKYDYCFPFVRCV